MAGRPAMRRLAAAWRALGPDQHLAALAAAGLFLSMFLPWYSKADTLVLGGSVHATRVGFSAWEAFSWVEAAVLLVSACILWMLFARGDGRGFKLPGGDGAVVMVAGGWTAFLVFYRLLDKPGLSGNQKVTATVGVEWGIFITLLIALALIYAGSRMRHAEGREPPLRGPRRGGRGGDRQPEQRRPAADPWADEDAGWIASGEEPVVRRRARPAPAAQRPGEDGPRGAREGLTPAARRARAPFAEPLPEPEDPPLAPSLRPREEAAPPAPAQPPRSRPPRPPGPAEQLSFDEDGGPGGG